MSDKTAIEWTDATPLRVVATAAARVGLTLDEYRSRLAAGQKWCGGCREWHARAKFGADRSRTDGLASRCALSHVVAKPGSPGARERRIRAATGEAWCRGCAAWLAAGEVRQGVCRMHAAEEARVRYAKNPAPVRARKSARRRGLEAVPPWWREDCFDGFGGVCAYGCGRAAQALDHIWPVARGGKSVPGNLVPTCVFCNSSKKAGDPKPWVDRGFEQFPFDWLDKVALAIEHGTDEWVEGMNDV